MSTPRSDIPFLCDVDNTLLDNDRVTSVKRNWGSHVTTVFVGRGRDLLDPRVLSDYPAADISLDSIRELLQYRVAAMVVAG